MSDPLSPAWRPDPAGRHPYRYFDGQRWTEHVSDGQTQTVDPLPEHRPAERPQGPSAWDIVFHPGHVAIRAMAANPHSSTVFQHFAFAGMFLVGLTFVSFGLLAASCHTSGRAAAQGRAAMIDGLEVRTISADALDPADVGRLVQVSGLARPDRPVVDDQTGVTMNALVLERATSMYQWIETCTQHNDRPVAIGPDVYVESDVRRPTRRRWAQGSVLQWTKCKYEKGWSAEPQSIDPERVGKYGNPPFPVDPGTQRFVPILWSVGRLTLSSDKLPKLPSEKLEPMALTPEQAEQLPEPLRGRARIHGNAFVVGDPNAPKVGDLRVAYVGRSEMTLTLIGERHGDGLRARHLPDGTELYEAREGALSTAELAGQRKQEAEDGWVPHAWFAGFVLAGTFLAFWPVRAWGRALPGPALLTGAGVLLFVPLAAMALYAATLAHAWWTPARGAAVVALAAAAGAAALLVVAGAVRQLLLPRQIAGT